MNPSQTKSGNSKTHNEFYLIYVKNSNKFSLKREHSNQEIIIESELSRTNQAKIGQFTASDA